MRYLLILTIVGWSVASQPTPSSAQIASAGREQRVDARPSFAQPAISPDKAEIAFVHGGDIWAVPGTGGTARLLIANAANESRPLYAPDGGRLAFMSDRAGSDDLYVLDLASGGARRITWGDSDEHLDAWSADGEWLYFTDGSKDIGTTDILRVRSRGGTPMAIAADRFASEFTAAPAPDGTSIALAGHGRMAFPQWWRNGSSHIDESEIWLIDDFADGTPRYRRLSESASKNLWPMWTPRGIAHMSDRSGAENLWLQPVDGVAAQLTHFDDGRLLWPSASADGTAIVFERDFGIWWLDLPDGEARRVSIDLRGAAQSPPVEHVRITSDFGELALSPDGKKIAFVAGGDVFAASAEDGGRAARVTTTVAPESEVTWAPDSRRIVYVSRRDGHPQLYLYDFGIQREERLTDSPASDVTPAFSPDGRLLAFARDGRQLIVHELDSGSESVVAEGDLWRAPFTPARPLAWSPDGQWLAFFASDARMFTNVNVVPADGSSPARAVSRLANSSANSLGWTPDGRSIYFDTQQRTEDGLIARIDLVPRSPVFQETSFRELFEEPADSDEGNDEAEPDATDSAHKPVRVTIDFDGIFRRLSLLPLGVDASTFALSPDGETIVFTAQSEGQSNLYAYSLDELGDEPAVARQLTSSPGRKSTPQFTPDGETIVFLDRGRITRVPLEGGDARTVAVSAERDVDFDRQKLEVFEQGWTYLRDHFYDPGMHGADWAQVREEFAPQIAGAGTRAELGRLMNLMVGELNASHLGYRPPSGDGPDAETGRLGLRFDRVEYERDGALRITTVIPLGPADLGEAEVINDRSPTPIGPGDYLLAVNGEPIGNGVSLDRVLANTVGDRVELRVADSSDGDGARTVAVHPISTGAEGELAYRNWVNSRRAYVDSISGGRFGYVHMPDMSWGSLQQLILDLDAANFGKEGVVVDIRNNNGGFVNAYALDVFAREGYMTMEVRGYPEAPARSMLGQRALEAPTVLVINQNSLSDAEDFTEGYRTLDLGPVVGEPTAGWIIFTWGLELVDGGSFRMPRALIRGSDGEGMELNPRPVDLYVERPLGESYLGTDVQLDAAVEALSNSARNYQE
ncbi:MAG TPA: S41 family peptidase [Longimicrobiaceae bacterium]|nr:S41 family peptidase [Longimicrobiaceae bacterium]